MSDRKGVKRVKEDYKIPELNGIYEMTNENVDEFAECAALAYKDYPLFKYLTNDDYNYKVIKNIILSSIKSMNSQMLGLSNNKEFSATVILCPPGYSGSKALPFLLNGGLKLFFMKSPLIFFRLMNYENHAMKIKKKYTNHDCWYLYNATVKPEFQRQGEISKLLNPIFKFLDRIGQDCYLETHKEENVKLYEHFGFELVETSKIPKTDFVQYSMLRRANLKEVKKE